jgi:hypothetical protein
MKRILVVLLIVGFVYVDQSLWTGWTRNEATDKLNKLIEEWQGKENKVP